MSTTYCIWVDKVFNSLTCNLFKNIDLRSVLHEGSIWSVSTVVLLWYGEGGPRAPGRRSQRHSYWPSWPSPYKDNIGKSIPGRGVLYQHCSHRNRTSPSALIRTKNTLNVSTHNNPHSVPSGAVYQVPVLFWMLILAAAPFAICTFYCYLLSVIIRFHCYLYVFFYLIYFYTNSLHFAFVALKQFISMTFLFCFFSVTSLHNCCSFSTYAPYWCIYRMLLYHLLHSSHPVSAK